MNLDTYRAKRYAEYLERNADIALESCHIVNDGDKALCGIKVSGDIQAIDLADDSPDSMVGICPTCAKLYNPRG